MIHLAKPEIWFVCGSQHLYGPGPLQKVAANAEEVVGALARSPKLPLKVVFKPLLTTPDDIAKLCLEANADANCAGLDPVDAHVLAVENVDPRPRARCRSRSSISTRSSTRTCRGRRSTWTS